MNQLFRQWMQENLLNLIGTEVDLEYTVEIMVTKTYKRWFREKTYITNEFRHYTKTLQVAGVPNGIGFEGCEFIAQADGQVLKWTLYLKNGEKLAEDTMYRKFRAGETVSLQFGIHF